MFWKRWVSIRTESGSRADQIDRLQALFKTNNLKSKISMEGNSLKRIHVLKKDVERAKELLAIFDQEE